MYFVLWITLPKGKDFWLWHKGLQHQGWCMVWQCPGIQHTSCSWNWINISSYNCPYRIPQEVYWWKDELYAMWGTSVAGRVAWDNKRETDCRWLQVYFQEDILFCHFNRCRINKAWNTIFNEVSNWTWKCWHVHGWSPDVISIFFHSKVIDKHNQACQFELHLENVGWLRILILGCTQQLLEWMWLTVGKYAIIMGHSIMAGRSNTPAMRNR